MQRPGRITKDSGLVLQESLQATINQLVSKIDASHSVNIQDTVKSIQIILPLNIIN